MTYHAMTTLNDVRKRLPLRKSWERILAHLGKTKADDEPLQLLAILNSNGFDEATACLQAKSLDRLSRHFQAWCAEQVLHHFEHRHPDDNRVRDQIAMLRNDDATEDQRNAAQMAATYAALSCAASCAAPHGYYAASSASANNAQKAAWAAQVAAKGAVESESEEEYEQTLARSSQEAQLRAMISPA